MKWIGTILLLAVLSFNLVGYRLFTSYLEDRANAHLEAQLDNDEYNGAQLLSIKIPISNIAYYNSSKTFDRVDGQVEINGTIYKFVKRRLYQDSIELLCIPNTTEMQLKTAKDEFFKLVNDLQSNAQSKKAGSHKNLSKDFSSDNYTVNDLFLFSSLNSALTSKIAQTPVDFSSLFSVTEEPPPDILS